MDKDNWAVDSEALEVETPAEFHDSKLGKFITVAHTNSLQTFRKYRSFWDFTSRINTAHETILGNLFNATPVLSAFLVHRAHSAYLGTVRLATSTQALDAYPLMRSALEYGLYAIYFKDYPEVGKIWQKRHESAKARRDVQDKIKTRNLIKHLQNKDRRLKAVIQGLYEITIDMGGHPNVYGVSGGLEIDDDPQKATVTFQNNTLVGEAPIFHLCCLHTAAIGVAVLEMMCLVYPERAKLIGVIDTARDLREELAHFSRVINRFLQAKAKAEQSKT